MLTSRNNPQSLWDGLLHITTPWADVKEGSCYDDAKPNSKNDRSYFELAFAEQSVANGP